MKSFYRGTLHSWTQLASLAGKDRKDMDLKQYEQKKFAIAEVIRSAHAIDTKDETLLVETRDLLARLAEDRFNLLVVGRFSRGKSTLMNAILGGDYLPTGIVPLTSAITTVRYGSRKQVVLNFSDFGLRREIPLSRLSEYVTQKENPGNIKKLAYAEIELPVEILRRGFFFVDTPGLGSPILENTLTTERFLPEADAFVLVTSYESPLSEEEDRILQRIRNTNKKLFIAVNKQDTVGPEERQEAIFYIKERLEKLPFAGTAYVFSISAREALHAKQTRDDGQLEASGVQGLETELLRFLTEERAQSFLENTYERTMDFLVHRSRSQEHPEHHESFKQLIDEFRKLKETIIGHSHLPEKAVSTNETISPASYSLQLNQKTGCSICGAILQAILDFLREYQYQLTVNPHVQQEHAYRGGFCPLHTWQYETISSPYGVCVAYPGLVHRIAAELKDFAEGIYRSGESMESVRRLLPTAKTCRVCEVRIDAEEKAVQATSQIARRADTLNAAVPACCLSHLIMVTEALGPGEAAQKLLEAHSDLLERTTEDLQRYAIKHDALRRYLTSEEERQASQLALLLLAGHRNVGSPWVIEYI